MRSYRAAGVTRDWRENHEYEGGPRPATISRRATPCGRVDPADVCGPHLAPRPSPPRSAANLRYTDISDPSKTSLFSRGDDTVVPPNGGVENPPRRPLWSGPVFSTPPKEGSRTPLRWIVWRPPTSAHSGLRLVRHPRNRLSVRQPTDPRAGLRARIDSEIQSAL